MIILKFCLLFVLGTVFGSFGGVLISRNRDKKGIKSILFGRSKCDKCGKTLSSIELIPLISFFVQKGKCKNCGTKLSNFYWILELVIGVTFMLTYLLFPYGNIGELIARLLINWGFVLLMVVDHSKYELHFPMRIITTVIALIFSFLDQTTKEIIITTGILCLLFTGIYFLSKYYVKLKYKKNGEGFGQGDIYLAGTIGVLFPFIFSHNNINFNTFNMAILMLMYIIVCCILGLLYAIIRNKISKKSKEIPFIPSMIFAFRILLFFGNIFINFMTR